MAGRKPKRVHPSGKLAFRKNVRPSNLIDLPLFVAGDEALLWERIVPGGSPRRGILGLATTRGDRLFISLLGSAYIHLAWLAFVGPSLWGALAISLVFAFVVFRWV